METSQEDEDLTEQMDSAGDKEGGSTTSPVRRWNRVEKTQGRRSRKARKPEVGTTPGSDPTEGDLRELEEETYP